MNIIMFLPECFLTAFAVRFLFASIFQKKDLDSNLLEPILLSRISYYCLIGLTCVFFVCAWISYPLHGTLFDGCFAVDKLSILAKMFMFCAGIGWFGLCHSPLNRSLRREDYVHYEYPALFLFTLIGSFVLVSAHHFLVMYVALELQALAICISIGLRQETGFSLEGALKYFFSQFLASSFLLLGIAFIFGSTGVLNFEEVFLNSDFLNQSPWHLLWFRIGFCLILSGILFKLTLFPFHFWVVDVYEGSTLTQVAIFSALVKTSVVFLLCRLLLKAFYNLIDFWKPILEVIGILSIIWGAFGALFQKHMRRLFAYAEIGQIGFIMIGFSTGIFTGFLSGLMYLLIYNLALIAFFFFWANLSYNDQNLETFDEVKGLARRYPLESFFMAILIGSMAGIPPLAGFWSKFFIFFTLANHKNVWLIVLLILLSCISSFYYLRMIKDMYFNEPTQNLQSSYTWKTMWTLVPFCIAGFVGLEYIVSFLIKEGIKSVL